MLCLSGVRLACEMNAARKIKQWQPNGRNGIYDDGLGRRRKARKEKKKMVGVGVVFEQRKWAAGGACWEQPRRWEGKNSAGDREKKSPIQ